jgi:hypothetical protein
MSKAPITLALFGILFVMFLLFPSWGNELLANLPPRSYYPHDRQYETMEVKAVLGFAALTQWPPALSANRPPFQHIAFELTLTPPEALCLTQDQSLTVASGACAVGSINLCAVIVGINDPKIRVWAAEICGLPIFWDLKPNAETSDWSNGRILDLETLQDHPLNVTVTSGWLVLRISDQAPIHWQETTVSPVGCDSWAAHSRSSF